MLWSFLDVRECSVRGELLRVRGLFLESPWIWCGESPKEAALIDKAAHYPDLVLQDSPKVDLQSKCFFFPAALRLI